MQESAGAKCSTSPGFSCKHNCTCQLLTETCVCACVQVVRCSWISCACSTASSQGRATPAALLIMLVRSHRSCKHRGITCQRLTHLCVCCVCRSAVVLDQLCLQHCIITGQGGSYCPLDHAHWVIQVLQAQVYHAPSADSPGGLCMCAGLQWSWISCACMSAPS